MRQRPCFLLYAALALFVGSSHQCLGVLANAWHIPNNTSDLGFNMRNPAFEIGASTTTSNQATAAGSPFTIRNRPAWLFDAGNRVISPGSDASPSNLDSIASACCRNDPVG